MKNLVICIKIIVGYHFIVVHSNYIISYWTEGENPAKIDLNILSMKTNQLFQFDGKEIISKTLNKKGLSNLSIISSEEIKGYTHNDTLGYVSLDKFILNNSSERIYKRTHIYSPLIDTYIHKKYRRRLRWISDHFSLNNTYLYEVEDVSSCYGKGCIDCGLQISKIESIKEYDVIDKDIKLFIKRIESLNP